MGAFCSRTFISCWPQTRLPLCADNLSAIPGEEKMTKMTNSKQDKRSKKKPLLIECSTYNHGPEISNNTLLSTSGAETKRQRRWFGQKKKKKKDEPSLSPPAGSNSICSLIMTERHQLIFFHQKKKSRTTSAETYPFFLNMFTCHKKSGIVYFWVCFKKIKMHHADLGIWSVIRPKDLDF